MKISMTPNRFNVNLSNLIIYLIYFQIYQVQPLYNKGVALPTVAPGFRDSLPHPKRWGELKQLAQSLTQYFRKK